MATLPVLKTTKMTPCPALPLIVQARCASSRYAQKVLRLFAYDHSFLEFQLIRLKKAFPSSPIVVATTTSPSDQAIEDIALRNKVACFRGSEQDVLQRFLNCCTHFHFTAYIVRICSDNPFLQMELLRRLIKEASNQEQGIDYISYSIDHRPAILTHFGFFCDNNPDGGPLFQLHITATPKARGTFNILGIQPFNA